MSHSPSRSGTLRQYGVALRILLVFTVVLGIGYPAVVLAAGQLVFPSAANGSLVSSDGRVIGSSLIGQGWTDAEGAPLAEWFQSRPSAAGDGYDSAASSGSNQGPESDDLVAAIEERRAAVAGFDGVDAALVPADALTASGSGLDPQISPEYARLQSERVASARGIPLAEVSALVESKIYPGDLGYLSEPTVNVLELNVALAKLG